MNKRTQELMKMLSTEESLETYFMKNKEELLDISLPDYLSSLLIKYHISKNEVIRRSYLNQIYGYQIFAGTKSPSRDKLISIIFGFQLHLDDAQRMLKIGGANELYPRKRRDSIVIFGLNKKLTVQELDDLLFEMGEDTLIPKD